ncbi:MAG: hypothetical protein WA977_04375 [Halobacteriota archaeon]
MAKRSKGKGFVEPCAICLENRWTEAAHFPKRKRDGGGVTIYLCPTHHKLIDSGRISRKEIERLRSNQFPNEFKTPEDLIEWANQNEYPYSLQDLKDKFWDHK